MSKKRRRASCVAVWSTVPSFVQRTEPPSGTDAFALSYRYSTIEIVVVVPAPEGEAPRAITSPIAIDTATSRRTMPAPLPSDVSDRTTDRVVRGRPVSFRAMAHRVTIDPRRRHRPGGGAAARLVLDAADVGISWDERSAGSAALEEHGELMPEETLDSIRASRVALEGPDHDAGGRRVPQRERRAPTGTRPVRCGPARARAAGRADPPPRRWISWSCARTPRTSTRASSSSADPPRRWRSREELRALGGFEMREDAGITVKPISVSGTRRIVRFAFEYARANGRKKVTVGHKANVMRYSDGLFLRTAEQESRGFPDVEWEEIQIDHLSSRLARGPAEFDVLLLPNLYGDIISDLCAGLVGGLGLIPGANIGWEYAVFEPVHGSAPDIAGRGLANPIAMILSGAMLLRHVGELAAAENVEWAVDEVLARGEVRTPDLGGSATTMEVAEEIAMQVTAWEHGPS